MTDLGEKLKLLKCPDDMKDNALKFAATLAIVDTEELKGILDFLTSKGILKEEEGKILLTPSAFKILPRGLDFIKEQVAKMEKIGHLACYAANPARINAIDADKRLLYMQRVGDSVINGKGKYSKLPFHSQLFKEKYGDIDLNNIQEAVKSSDEINEKSIDFGVTTEDIKAPAKEEAKKDAPVMDPIDNNSPVIDSTPVSLDADAAIAADEISNDGEAFATGDAAFEEENVSLSDAIVSGEMTPEVQTPQAPVAPIENNPDDRLNVIVECLNKLYAELFGMPSVPAEMVESAKQYLAASGLDNSSLIFELLTSGSSYTDEQKGVIKAKIDEHLGMSVGGR